MVTITAATLFTRSAVGGTFTPIFRSRFDKLWVENTVCCRSPVPCSRLDHQPVADQHVVTHAFDRHQVLDPGRH